jgi:ribosomal protein L3
MAKDGYTAVQLGFGVKKEKNTPGPMIGHFKKANTAPLRVVWETEYFEPVRYKAVTNEEGQVSYEEEQGAAPKSGDALDVSIFRPGDTVSVVGKSKGKGFQGVVKRHVHTVSTTAVVTLVLLVLVLHLQGCLKVPAVLVKPVMQGLRFRTSAF